MADTSLLIDHATLDKLLESTLAQAGVPEGLYEKSMLIVPEGLLVTWREMKTIPPLTVSGA